MTYVKMRDMWQQIIQKIIAWIMFLASPKYFYQQAGRWTLWFGSLATGFIIAGLIGGLFFAPADYQQGDAFRIIYVHVPAAFLSMAIYSFMTVCAFIALIWRIKLAEILISVSVSVGLWMTFLALVTGAIWGKPMWGTAWIWDARLTSELILFFIYFAIFAVLNAIRDPATAARAAAMVILLGAIDIPIVHYSVQWWNTLHQGSTILQFDRPAMDSAMLYPLLMMMAGFLCYAIALIVYRARTEILWREKKARWVGLWIEKKMRGKA